METLQLDEGKIKISYKYNIDRLDSRIDQHETRADNGPGFGVYKSQLVGRAIVSSWHYCYTGYYYEYE